MAVFNVEAEYLPNGNRRSRPIVADDEQDAIQIAHAEWDIADRDPLFKWTVAPRPDPDGHYERLLLDAERRRMEAEYYR
jgi:hypothetical protein